MTRAFPLVLALAGCTSTSATVGDTGIEVSTTPSVGTPAGISTSTGTPGGTTTPTPTWQLEVSTVRVGDSLGLRTNQVAATADCVYDCEDLDLDGLTDAWEAIVLDRFRPAVRFDEAEPLVNDPSAVLADVGRVALADDGSGAVRVYIMIGYSEDYGRCGISAHPGDSERVAIDLELTGPGDADALGFYTAAHEGTITDSGRVFQDGDLALLTFVDDPTTLEPRWMVWSSDGKHATYGSAQLCEDAQWAPCIEEDCEADGVDPIAYTRVPDIWNAGEEYAPFLTELSSVGFPGEEAWADQEFCGGLSPGVFGCASAVREKLLVDPF